MIYLTDFLSKVDNKKISFFIVFLTLSILTYLSIFGFETDKFNSLIEKKISENQSEFDVNLERIKFKIDLKKLSFYITTPKPKVKYKDTKLTHYRKERCQNSDLMNS